jgi:HlyD family secretion protein
MSKKKKIFIIILVVILVTAYFYVKNLVAKKKENSGDITLVEVTKKDLITKVTATGQLQPRLKIQITAPQRGQVDEILVNEGDKVKRGQKLAWLSSDSRIALLDAARINQAKAQESGDRIKLAKHKRSGMLHRQLTKKYLFFLLLTVKLLYVLLSRVKVSVEVKL